MFSVFCNKVVCIVVVVDLYECYRSNVSNNNIIDTTKTAFDQASIYTHNSAVDNLPISVLGDISP